MRGVASVLAVCLWVLLAAPLPSQAKPSPAASCQITQLGAASRLASGDLKCWSKYHKKPAAGLGALADCRTRGEGAFTSAYDDAVAEAGAAVCALDDTSASVLAGLQDEIDALELGITGGATGADKTEQSLFASLLGAVGSGLAGALKAEAKDAKKPDAAKRLAGRAKARDKLLSSFAKALAKAGAGYTGLGGAAVADEVDRIADELAAATEPLFFAISGTIQAADGAAVDSDVNDPNSPPAQNNLEASAQVVSVPAAIGGYVNLLGQGPAGSLQATGDPDDFYRVFLTFGQRVNLRFGNPQEDDLDLCVYPVGFTPSLFDCSLGTSDTEEVPAFTTGEHFVRVNAFAGASSYVLTIGQTLASAGPSGPRLSDDFVPGEAVVTLAAPPATLAVGPPAPAATYEADFAMQAVGGASDREMLFRLPADAGARAASLAALGAAPAHPLQHRLDALPPEQRAKYDTLLALKALARQPEVASAEPNYLRHAQATPSDTFYGLQWHYPLINLPGAWDLETGDASVEVAVIDTGVLFGHPDLAPNLSSQFDYDFVSDASRALDGGGIDDNAEDPGDGAGVQPSSFHGTHVAGTIGARSNNGVGVAGVNWNVTLVPLRALGRFGSGTSYDILQAVRYAAGLANDSGTSHKVDVINLSLGGTGSSSAEQAVYDQARAAGVIVVAAAGNNASSQLFYPASYNNVVSVSAVDLRRQLAPYSNFGSAVDVAAPGGDTGVDRNGDGYPDGVLSTLRDEGTGSFVYGFYQGTSMAAPHVAGVAALMKAVDPALTPAQFDALLASGQLSVDLGLAGRDNSFGHGLIDARKAVEAAGATASDDPLLLVDPSGLNLGTSQSQAPFQVANGGGGSLSITSVTDDQAWLSVAPLSVDGDGLGTYQVTVDRSGLPNGNYTGTVTVASNAGNATVSVVMAVLAGAPSADAGFHYVLVVDPIRFENVAQFDVPANGGAYDFDLSAVPSGFYLLYAGSDPDNNFFICGPGEACGAYPTLGTPELIEIRGDRSNLDFVTGFLQTLAAGASAGPAPAEGPGLPRQRPHALAR